MRTETLLDEMLSGCELRRETGAPAGVQRIRAVPRPGRLGPAVREAVLDVDEASRILRRLELRRVRGGQPLATVTFTFADAQIRADVLYQLEGHLDSTAPVFEANYRPRQRLLVLWKYFGIPLLRGQP
jgi:hypothetical protein